MKKFLILLAVIVVLVIVILVVCADKEQSGEKEKVVPISFEEKSGEEAKTPEPKKEYKETNPYVANIPNEILDFYKEKVEAIEEKHKKEQEQLLKENPNMNVTDLKNLKYDLVFFDDNNTPELVVTDEGLRTALYTYDAGEVIYAMKESSDGDDEYGWTFGAGGNHGYEYVPRENTLRNIDSDYAGLIRYYNFYELDEKTHQLVPINVGDLIENHFEDKNNNGKVDDDEMEPYFDEPTFYIVGTRRANKEDWEKNLIDGEYEELVGTKTAAELFALLDSLVNEK